MGGYRNEIQATIGEADEIEVEVEFSISAFVPGKMHLSNGDPGYPDEGNELEDFKVTWRGLDITRVLTEAERTRIVDQCYEDKHKNA